jgi:hypothetical protein
VLRGSQQRVAFRCNGFQLKRNSQDALAPRASACARDDDRIHPERDAGGRSSRRYVDSSRAARRRVARSLQSVVITSQRAQASPASAACRDVDRLEMVLVVRLDVSTVQAETVHQRARPSRRALVQVVDDARPITRSG